MSVKKHNAKNCYFDNVIWQVEQLQKNDFLFFESNAKKENDKQSLSDKDESITEEEHGIPLERLISTRHLFSGIKFESPEKNGTNNIK